MIEDFIGVFDNALSKEHCDELIKIYEDSVSLNFTMSRQELGKQQIKQDNNLGFINDKKFINRIYVWRKNIVSIYSRRCLTYGKYFLRY